MFRADVIDEKMCEREREREASPTDVQTQNQTLIIPHELHELPGGVGTGAEGPCTFFPRLAASSLVRFFHYWLLLLHIERQHGHQVLLLGLALIGEYGTARDGFE
jgi:hypothetical protein